MNVLIIGGGGREHAIAWKLAKSPRVNKLYCAPGNGGTAAFCENVAIKATDLDAIVDYAQSKKVDLVFVAPDDPLALGLVDALELQGIRAFGPRKSAAIIEASKSFSKDLMHRYDIPTAAYAVFSDLEPANAYLETCDLPIVVKADGLALGKGVIIAETLEDAKNAVSGMLEGTSFGSAGRTVVIEEFMTGPELTVLAFTDGKTVKAMVSSRDHKRALDGDKGLNTGGMGAVAPGAECSDADWQQMQDTIFQPTIDAMYQEGRPFKGVIYFGLMLTSSGPKVIEYNARFGDPEAQAILPLLQTDLMDIVDAILDERLDQLDIRWSQASSCCLVLASGGYPQSYQKGYVISGLDKVKDDTIVFHAGTSLREDGAIITNGGRVLGVTSTGKTLDEAIDKAYEEAARISFTHMHFRKDIGRT